MADNSVKDDGVMRIEATLPCRVCYADVSVLIEIDAKKGRQDLRESSAVVHTCSKCGAVYKSYLTLERKFLGR